MFSHSLTILTAFWPSTLNMYHLTKLLPAHLLAKRCPDFSASENKYKLE